MKYTEKMNRPTRKPATHRASEGQAEALFMSAEFFESIGEARLALRCLSEAAEAGHELSQHALANAYSLGKGVRRDTKLAAAWYKKAFNNRSRTASYSGPAVGLAAMLKQQGDLKGAIRWLEKARALRDGVAYTELAKIHASRKGGQEKARELLQEMLSLGSENITDMDREIAGALLRRLSAD